MSGETAINTTFFRQTAIHTDFMSELAITKYREKSSHLKNSIDLVSDKYQINMNFRRIENSTEKKPRIDILS